MPDLQLLCQRLPEKEKMMLIHNLTELQNEYRTGRKLKYLPFWGHTPRNENVVDKSCFSQWFPRAFVVDGVVYPTAEHFMMAQKAKLFHDDAVFAQIIASSHPKQAKDLGRQVVGFDEDIWREHREEIVFRASVAKFSQHEDLKAFLIGTGQRVLVEASPVDNIWGIGMAQDNPFLDNPTKWNGLNLLGFALMKARHYLTEHGV